LNSEDIKAHVVEQLARAERMIPSERSGAWYERQTELYQLWLQAEQAEQLARVATAVELLERGG
jgi:hypothetical protein